ncbi:hypothetical protein A5662_17695 [Mycobacteriaceae bacterium 1482268.1]|nr:hypothetical protein A5662_17695 [Mycobacteriaceae bacterium 1482268.1]
MSRKVAVAWHALFSIAAGFLYFFFILPRWPELMGSTSHTLGTVLRIVAGALIGTAALPVVFTLLRTRKPELGTPQLALSLRTSSIALHVLAGVLIVGTAISEIWLSLDSAGRWLFGIYGAAAAIALLGISAFYLAFVAELPPPPPKPLKPKSEKKQRRRGRKAAAEADSDETAADAAPTEADSEQTEADEAEDSELTEEQTGQPAEVTAETPEKSDESETSEESENGADSADGGLRNRRSSGKLGLRKRRRSRGGVAVDD